MNSDKKLRLYARAVIDASKAYFDRCRDLRAMRPSLELLDADMFRPAGAMLRPAS